MDEDCQLACLHTFSQGTVDYPEMTLFSKVKLEVKKRLSPKTFHSLRKLFRWMITRFRFFERKDQVLVEQKTMDHLVAGDLVRVRSQQEIEEVLDNWKETRFCGFMDGMWDYCNTIQIVKQPVKRFVHERTYQVKRARGIVLLENVFCTGTIYYGKCDRSCYFFWREEWLEKVSDRPADPKMDFQLLKNKVTLV